MEKAIEIKRRAQRCVQNGDLDGALREYAKLVETPDSDPYNFVLLADLLFKKGEQGKAAERYLHAVTAYEKAGLYKNAIAVCKKMTRLSLAHTQVLKHLAELHALDGLVSEASVYWSQYADVMLRANNGRDAIDALRKAFDAGQENVRILEQLADALLGEGQPAKAAVVLREAAEHWRTRKHEADARKCLDRANLADPASARAPVAPATATGAPRAGEAAPPPATPGEAEPAAAAPVAETDALARDPAFESRTRLTVTAFASGPPVLRTGDVQGLDGSDDLERPQGFVAPEHAPPTDPTIEADAPFADAPAAEEDAPAAEEAAPPAGVFDAGAEAGTDYERALAEAEAMGRRAPRTDPYAQRDPVPSPSMVARRPPEIPTGAVLVEQLLHKAQEDFRAGRRDAASQALVEAAQAYEGLGRLDSAATIFRSLGRGAQSPTAVMELWLANCEKRGDRAEGSQVACELGDRALNDAQEGRARAWFEHAAALDPANDTARRRLQRMASGRGGAPAAAPEAGRVAVAVGRGQAVTFDLDGLLQEFQRGVDQQLDGDAQGHYDLGMAYREMGLHEQAVQSFEISLRDPRFAGIAHEMIGRSHAETGQHEAAVKAFGDGLRANSLDAAGEAELRFQTAMSMAALGDLAGAVAQLEIADMRSPGRPDVLHRLTEWRRAFGQAA